MNKGHVSIATIVSITTGGIMALGGVFAWTYTQFMGVSAHAATTDVHVATVEQKTTDIDDRLTRIETKLDNLLSKTK